MSKRRKSGATDARRLRGYADDLRGISSAISAQCAFPHKRRQAALPLRANSAAANRPPPPPSARARRPPAEPPRSLFSVVSAATALAAGAGVSAGAAAPAGARDAWRQTLLAAAAELGADGDAQERCGRLLRRVDALSATVAVQQEQLKQQSSEIAVNERVEAQLEREEREWEDKMQVREQRVAELEVELKALQEVNDASFSADARERGDDERDDDGDDAEDGDAVAGDEGDDANDQEAAARNVELREALALRMEERRDIQAALASLQRKKQQRGFSAERAQAQSTSAPPSESERALSHELQALQDEKDALQRQIIASEEEQEENDEHSAELPSLKASVAEAKQRRAAQQERLDRAKHALARLKSRMKHMVDVQLLTAGDTIPSALREEAVILHLLFVHEGEMGVNELKLETAAAMAAHGKPSASGAVIRALYSLVANGVVQIDRSYGNGLVTSLLV